MAINDITLIDGVFSDLPTTGSEKTIGWGASIAVARGGDMITSWEGIHPGTTGKLITKSHSPGSGGFYADNGEIDTTGWLAVNTDKYVVKHDDAGTRLFVLIQPMENSGFNVRPMHNPVTANSAAQGRIREYSRNANDDGWDYVGDFNAVLGVGAIILNDIDVSNDGNVLAVANLNYYTASGGGNACEVKLIVLERASSSAPWTTALTASQGRGTDVDLVDQFRAANVAMSGDGNTFYMTLPRVNVFSSGQFDTSDVPGGRFQGYKTGTAEVWARPSRAGTITLQPIQDLNGANERHYLGTIATNYTGDQALTGTQEPSFVNGGDYYQALPADPLFWEHNSTQALHQIRFNDEVFPLLEGEDITDATDGNTYPGKKAYSQLATKLGRSGANNGQAVAMSDDGKIMALYQSDSDGSVLNQRARSLINIFEWTSAQTMDYLGNYVISDVNGLPNASNCNPTNYNPSGSGTVSYEDYGVVTSNVASVIISKKPTENTYRIAVGESNNPYGATLNTQHLWDNAKITVLELDKGGPIVDTLPPGITLLGFSPTTTYQGFPYTDAGVTASDDTDGDLSNSVTTVNPVDINTVSGYTITYNVSDAANNPAIEVTRTVNVVTAPAPVITLTGPQTVDVQVGVSYFDAGATATDAANNDISSSIVTLAQNLDLDTVGSYSMTFNVTDLANNPAIEVFRTINVNVAPDGWSWDGAAIDSIIAPTVTRVSYNGLTMVTADNDLVRVYDDVPSTANRDIIKVRVYTRASKTALWIAQPDSYYPNGLGYIEKQPPQAPQSTVTRKGVTDAFISDDGLTFGLFEDNVVKYGKGGGSGPVAPLAEVYAFNGTTWSQKGPALTMAVGNASITDGVATGFYGRYKARRMSASTDASRIVTFNTYAKFSDTSIQVHDWDNVSNAYVTSANIAPVSALTDESVSGVAMSADGLTIVAGNASARNSNADPIGAAWVYRYDGANWNLLGTPVLDADNNAYSVISPDASNETYMGCSVAISGDGNRIVLGARSYDAPGANDSDRGAFITYDWDGTQWVLAPIYDLTTVTSDDRFGSHVAVSRDGIHVAVTQRSYSDEVFIFFWDGSKWLHNTSISPIIAPGYQHGYSTYGAFFNFDFSGDSRTLVYSHENDAGDATDTVLRGRVEVFDLPVVLSTTLTINGSNPVTSEINTFYSDAGATAVDQDGATTLVATSGLPDITQVGSYTVTYTAGDGPAQVTGSRVVNIEDSFVASLDMTLTGTTPVTTEINTAYSDAGATAVDQDGNAVAVVTTDLPDITQVGSYTVTYTATTPFLTDTLTRTVNVEDSSVPTITLIGLSTLVLPRDESFVDPFVVAYDLNDGLITNNVAVVGTVDVGTSGTYALEYRITNSAGNSASVQRSVTILTDNTSPWDGCVVELIPFVPGCPDGLILNEIRSAGIELCKLTDVYQETLAPIQMVEGQSTYLLDIPTDTVLEKILTVTSGGRELEPTSFQLVETRMPNRGLSQPTHYLKDDGNRISLFPSPDDSSAITIRVVLRPTTTSSGIKSTVLDDYKEAILYGALYRLLRHPAKEWGDPNAAREYSALFAVAVADATLKSRQADTGIARKTGYGGVATKTARRKYGRR